MINRNISILLTTSTDASVRACRLAIIAVFLAGALPLRAQSPANDAQALNTIFGDEYLATNILETCSQAAKRSPETRYKFLADRVLPGDRHRGFRVVADFSPTHPAPTSADPEHASGFRVPAGGEIISPVLALIDTATALDRLEELRRIIEATSATSVEDRVDQLALLALVDMAGEDIPSAQTNLAELFTLVLPEEDTEPRQLDPLLLCVDAAAHHPRLSLTIVDAAHRVVQSYQQVYERTAWQRQYSAAFARVQRAARYVGNDTTADSVSIPFSRWTPASPPRARYRGTGCPIARWVMRTGRADNLYSHDQDLLYFAVPLRGNYEVECDVTGFGWRDSSLLVAGKWVGPVYDLKSYDMAGVDGYIARIQFAPPLTRVGEYIHYRTVVRDGSATTYFNGRPIHTQPLPPDHDPWLAVRSAARQDGGVRNLWITGEPVVPEELRLANSPDLTHWVPYYEEVVGIDWQYRDAPGELHAPRNRGFPRGSAQESSSFYHRPMLEDGSIEYKFWYDPEVCEAHPALDRLCFLLHPKGVKLHWLTDGPFDRTSLPPDNLSDEPHNRRGSTPLPLAEQAWNQLRLTLHGDTVKLLLNGKLIYERDIEPTNQRHFGLFHYGDRTELRVRNMAWTGDWPREVPGVDAQELAIDEIGFLDERLPELTAVLTHDFGAAGLPPDRFTIIRGEVPAHINTGPDGVLMTRQGSGDGYIAANLATNLKVHGDFDIASTFAQFSADTRPDDGSCSIFLWVETDADHVCRMLRRRVFRTRDQQIVQCGQTWIEDGETRRRFFSQQTTEAASGTLRLARRGETIYFLFAENDSPQFRLIGQDAFPDDDLPLQGVRLILQTHGDGDSTSVVWKDLSIRAERLSGPAIEARRMFKLNREQ